MRKRSVKKPPRKRDSEARSEEIPVLQFPRPSLRPPHVYPAAAILICLALGGLWSGGCNGVNKAQGDPLFGNVKPQPGLNGAAANPVPPIPGPTSTASTAALASVNPRPIDGSHDLRITDPIGSPVASAPGTQLQPPTTGFMPVSRQPTNNGAPGADATRLSNGSMTYEEAQARLTARGVSWQRLETWGEQGDWKFTCSVPNRQNPYISRTYEAEAHDPLSAVRGVLDQLDHDQR